MEGALEVPKSRGKLQPGLQSKEHTTCVSREYTVCCILYVCTVCIQITYLYMRALVSISSTSISQLQHTHTHQTVSAYFLTPILSHPPSPRSRVLIRNHVSETGSEIICPPSHVQSTSLSSANGWVVTGTYRPSARVACPYPPRPIHLGAGDKNREEKTGVSFDTTAPPCHASTTRRVPSAPRASYRSRRHANKNVPRFFWIF